MEKLPKMKSQITVRISIGFQDAPDVHTLLSMTPVRGRGKLILHALEKHIKESGHPAGEISTQLDIISQWLKQRSDGISTDLTPDGEPLPISETKKPLVTKKEIQSTRPISLPHVTEHVEAKNEEFNTTQSASLKRWLSG